MAQATEIQAHILQKVEDDAEFRARLLADPKGIIEAETGGELPDDMLVFIHEQLANAQQEASSMDEPLTEDELLQVTGGCNPVFGEWMCTRVGNRPAPERSSH